MEEAGFWDDPEKATALTKELSTLKEDMDKFKRLETSFEDIKVLLEMGYEEEDPDMVKEIEREADEFVASYDSLYLKTLLSGEFDANNAILKLNAGAGGTESCDFNQMLYRMYSRWADSRKYKVEITDQNIGEEAGVKSIVLHIIGNKAYGWLKKESGIHRLVRISPSKTAIAFVFSTPVLKSFTI